VIKKSDDDIDYYFNLGNLDLEDCDIYNIIESGKLPAVLSKLITDTDNQSLSFSFTFYGNNKTSNEAANSFVSSVCSAPPKYVEGNIDLYGYRKVCDILVQDQYKSSVRIQYDQNNAMSNSTVGANEVSETFSKFYIGSQDLEDVCVTGDHTLSYDNY
jgi:hypothetical protein